MSLRGALEEITGGARDPLAMVAYLEEKSLDLVKVMDHLQWVCQTIHQAYHTDQPGTWIACPKSVCESTARLFGEVLK